MIATATSATLVTKADFEMSHADTAIRATFDATARNPSATPSAIERRCGAISLREPGERAHGALPPSSPPSRQEPAIRSVAAGQLGRTPALDDTPAIEHDHAIGDRDEPKAVRHDENGPAAREPADRIPDDALARRVEVRCRLVEDDQPGIGQECARDGDALTLATAQAHSVLPDRRLVAERQVGDEGDPRRPPRRPPGPPRHRRPVGPGGCCRRPFHGKDAAAAAPTRRSPATIPDRSRRAARPPTRIRPASGSRNRRSRFATVVLPAPVVPTSATTSPNGIVRSRPATAGTVRPR